MADGDWLERRLRPYSHAPRRTPRRDSFRRPCEGTTLGARITAQVDAAVARFEVDRLLYDVEVDALGEWVRRMVAFDAYCARRASGG